MLSALSPVIGYCTVRSNELGPAGDAPSTATEVMRRLSEDSGDTPPGRLASACAGRNQRAIAESSPHLARISRRRGSRRRRRDHEEVAEARAVALAVGNQSSGVGISGDLAVARSHARWSRIGEGPSGVAAAYPSRTLQANGSERVLKSHCDGVRL